MKNKITSLILVAAIALMANISINSATDTVYPTDLQLCYSEPDIEEF